MGMPSVPELIVIFFILAIYAIPIILHYRQKRVVLKHKTLQTIKEIPFLYSWTSAVFGFWTPLLRGDFKWFFIYLIVGIPTYNLGAVVLSFFYNKNYISSLIEKGYEPIDKKSKELLISNTYTHCSSLKHG